MLSRVADSLYWMARYLERAEHTARLIDVHTNLMLDHSGEFADQRWRRVVSSLGVVMTGGTPCDGPNLIHTLAYDVSSPCSIVNCIISARENARQVREQISSEMWEQLNRLFHEVRHVTEMQEADPLEFARVVRTGTHLFEGITDSTMTHGEAWQFIQLGRFLERAMNTAALVDQHFRDFYGAPESNPEAEHLEWLGLLKSCTAFEAYCKVYTAELRPQRIAEFLLLNEYFPHSLRFAVGRIRAAFEEIESASGLRRNTGLQKLAGRLEASLSYSHIDEIFQSGLHPWLNEVKRQSAQIHSAMFEAYINYSVQAAIGT
jgi:uncharacterized alpha-E superfamily protein